MSRFLACNVLPADRVRRRCSIDRCREARKASPRRKFRGPARVLVSIVEGAGTTQRFGRWTRPTHDALKRRGFITTTKLDAPDDCYAEWRVDLTAKGRTERAALIGKVEPFSFPEYPRRTMVDTCWHDPRYPVGECGSPLTKGHADFHRYVPLHLIELDHRK